MSETSGGQVESSLNEVSSAAANDESTAATPVSTGKASWVIATIVSAVLAVLALNFAPAPFSVEAKYETADLSATEAEMEEAAKAFELKEWKNALFAYAVAGFALGIPAIAVVPRIASGKSIGLILASLVFGALCGLIAVSLGTAISLKMRASYEFESMVPDLTVWSIMSFVLALPAAMSLVIAGERLLSQKVMSIPLGGVLAGILVTIGVSLFLPSANTYKIPPSGFALTLTWFTVLVGMILLMSTFTGARNRQPTAA